MNRPASVWIAMSALLLTSLVGCPAAALAQLDGAPALALRDGAGAFSQLDDAAALAQLDDAAALALLDGAAALALLDGAAALAQPDGAPAPAHLYDASERSGAGNWILLDAVGYGGLGFGLGVLAARAVDGSGAEPTAPAASAHFSGGFPPANYGFSAEGLVSGPDGTTLVIVGAATLAGTVAGVLIGLRAHRTLADGGRIGGIHRTAVVGGAVLAGGTLGALAAAPLLGGADEGTPLGSDEQTVAILAGAGAVLGALFVLRYEHELRSRSISVTPGLAPVGGRGAGMHMRVMW